MHSSRPSGGPQASGLTSPCAEETPPPGSRVVGGTSVFKAEPAGAAIPFPRLQRLKHYELIELIGRGGMGDVYRARDEQAQRIVAIKVLSPELTRDEQFVKRFEREARTLAKLEHPNIVPVYDIDRDQGHVFYAMQYVAGESLDLRLRRAGKCTLNSTLRIISQCVQALSAAHAQQLVHRDVKPGNVLLQDATEHVYLVDFGLVRRFDSDTSFTETGVVMGTVDYMSPEQARGSSQIDHRSDLYSIGVLFYHLVSGRLPFDTPSFQGMLYAHAYEKPLPIADAARDLPHTLAELVTRLLAKSPHDRPADCREVQSILEPFLQLAVRVQQLEVECQSAAKTEDAIELSAAEQRIEYLQALQAEGERLGVEVEQSASNSAEDANGAVVARQSDTIRQRMLEVNAELKHAIELRERCAALSVRCHRSHGTRLRTRHLVALATLLPVIIALLGAAISGFWRDSETLGEPLPPPQLSRIVAGESIELLPLLKLPDDVVAGNWQIDGQGNLIGANIEGLEIEGHARLQIPVWPQGDYEITCRYTVFNAHDVNVVFPAGPHSARATFGSWAFEGIEGALVAHDPGERHIGIKDAAANTNGSRSVHEARIVVRNSGDTSHIQIYVDGTKTCDWEGENRILENNEPCRIRDARAIGLTTGGNLANKFQSVSLRMLTGHAEINLRSKESVVAQPLHQATEGTRIPAGESIELIPHAELSKDVVAGNWLRDERGILYANTKDPFVKGYSDGHARLQFPVHPHGDFEVTCRYVINNLHDVSVVFPAGSESARVVFGFWEGEGRLVSHSGSMTHGITNAVATTQGDQKLHEARIVVRTLGNTSSIQIYVDGTLTCDWEGENKLLANNEPCQIRDRQAIGITTIGELANEFHSVSLKMLAGHADVARSGGREVTATVVIPTDLEGKEKGEIVAGESIELLPWLKLPEDVVMGNWQRDDKGALVGTSLVGPLSGHARVQLPARPQGDYKIKVRFSRLHEGDANVVFPVGRHSVRAIFGQIPEGGLVARGNGHEVLGVAGAIPQTSSTGGMHEAHIVVRASDEQAEVKIYVDRVLTCSWQGDSKTLEVNTPCAIPDASAIGLTTWGRKGTRFHSVVLEMLSGHAVLGRPTSEQEAIDKLEALRLVKELSGRWETETGDWIEFEGNRWSSGTPTLGPYRGQLRVLGLTKGVAKVDLMVEEGPETDPVQLIVKLEGDRLLYCGSYGDRPTEFAGRHDWALYDFERKKPHETVIPNPLVPQTYLEGPLELLTAAVEETPTDPQTWIRRGRWHLVRQNWKEARADYEKYLQLKPDNMWVRREYLDLCLALEEKDPAPYYALANYVSSLPAGRFALEDLRSLCLVPPKPAVDVSALTAWASRSGHPKTVSPILYLAAVHYRAGDYETCAAAVAETLPNGPQYLLHSSPCLFEAAALKKLGKDTVARSKLIAVRDFLEQGKTQPYQNPREKLILNYTFDTLHSQIFYREASELILGQREELKAPLAIDLINKQQAAK